MQHDETVSFYTNHKISLYSERPNTVERTRDYMKWVYLEFLHITNKGNRTQDPWLSQTTFSNWSYTLMRSHTKYLLQVHLSM